MAGTAEKEMVKWKYSKNYCGITLDGDIVLSQAKKTDLGMCKGS